MTDLNVLYPSLRLELPGVIEPALEDAVVESAQDFLRRSEVWKHTCPNALDWTTAANFPAITVGTDIPEDTRIVRVDEVKFDRGSSNYVPVKFATRQQLDELIPGWESKTGNSPLRWTSDGPGTWRIVPTATSNVTSSLRLRVVLSITDDATEIPDFVYYEFRDPIKYGALSRLLKTPGKDWTDIRLAGNYASMFEDEIVKARSRAQAEFGQPRREVAYGGI